MENVQGTITDFSMHLESWLEGFLIDRKAQNVAAGTLTFYQKKLPTFIAFCEGQAITRIDQVAPDALRKYMLWLEARRHNAGGIHACDRALRTFLFWYEQKAEPQNWRNPIHRVQAPRLALDPLAPLSLVDFAKLTRTCDGSFRGLRDRAVFYALLDRGARANEI